MLYPHRKTNKISQTFNSGIATIFSVSNRASAGYAPKPRLHKLGILAYEEQRLGINRYYQGLQNQIKIERVIRVPYAPIDTQCIASIEQKKYRIDMVQVVEGIFPSCLDLTLVKYEQEADYDIL